MNKNKNWCIRVSVFFQNRALRIWTRKCVYVSKLVNFSIEIVGGFIVLGIALFCLGRVCPGFYNFITEWTNAPFLGKISKCEVLKELPSEVEKHSSYRIGLTISDNTDSVYDLFFYTNGPGISVYEEGKGAELFTDDRNFIARRFVSSKNSRSREYIFDVTMDHEENGTVRYKKGTLEDRECPVGLYAFRRKSQ